MTRTPANGKQGFVSGLSIPKWKESLPTLEGRAWAFGFELTASHILEEVHAHLEPEIARRHLFAALDRTLADKLAPGDVIVADQMLGAFEAARSAFAALAAANVTALIARIFAPAFILAGHEHGLATLELDAPCFIRTNDRLRLDLDTAKVVNLSSGDRSPIRNLSDSERTDLCVALGKRLRR